VAVAVLGTLVELSQVVMVVLVAADKVLVIK
jgi:hypothetical protein